METLIFVVQFDLKFNLASSFLFCNRLTKRKLNFEIMGMERTSKIVSIYAWLYEEKLLASLLTAHHITNKLLSLLWAQLHNTKSKANNLLQLLFVH